MYFGLRCVICTSFKAKGQQISTWGEYSEDIKLIFFISGLLKSHSQNTFHNTNGHGSQWKSFSILKPILNICISLDRLINQLQSVLLHPSTLCSYTTCLSHVTYCPPITHAIILPQEHRTGAGRSVVKVWANNVVVR